MINDDPTDFLRIFNSDIAPQDDVTSAGGRKAKRQRYDEWREMLAARLCVDKANAPVTPQGGAGEGGGGGSGSPPPAGKESRDAR
jgi:hypothetical protein